MKSRILLVALGLTIVSNLSAQNLNTAYLSESYIFRHKMNPALSGDDGYFAIPLIADINLDLGTNFGISDFVKPHSGKLVTAFHESVPAADFINSLNATSEGLQSLDMTIFGMGFACAKSYRTFEVSFHEQAGAKLPKDLFTFMKEMNPDKTYQFGDAHISGRAWLDVAYGYSRNVNDELRLGGKLKALFGIGYADASFDQCNATFGAQKWQMNMKGSLTASLGGDKFEVDEKGKLDKIGEYETDLAGWGIGLDFGATYDMKRFVKGLTLSMAITDLGFLHWNDCEFASNDGTPFSYEGFNNFTLHNEDNHTSDRPLHGSLSDQWRDVRDDLRDMANFKIGENTAFTEALSATLNMAVEYKLPAYDKISFGALFQHRFSEMYGYTEGRVIVNYAPGRIFDMALSAAATSWGGTFGAVANFHVPGFNIFLGSDRIYTGTINKNMIPLQNGGVNVHLGINFTMGRPKPVFNIDDLGLDL